MTKSLRTQLAGAVAICALLPLAAHAETLVVFGPSSWDTFAPGAPEEVVQEVTDELDARFMEAHPEVTEITHDSRGTIADGLARLRNAQLAGDQVDVVVCAANPVNTSYARLGLIDPVGDVVEGMGDVFTEGSVENFTIDGTVWGVPISAVNLTTFFYNKEVFDAAGIEEPTTYEEFVAAVPALEEQGVIPVVHQGKNAWMWPLYYMSSLAQTTGNDQLGQVESVLAGEGSFTDPESLEALQLTWGWVEDGLLDPQSNELDENQMKSVFYSGRAAAYFGGSWDVPAVEVNAPFEWGVFKFPKYEDQPGEPVAFGGAESGLCISSTSPNKELAAAYIEFAASDDQLGLLLDPLTPLATSHVAMEGASDPIAEDLRSYLPADKFLDWVWPRELTTTIQNEVQSMMGGTITPEEAAENMQAKFDEMVEAGWPEE
ncbi:ABC transporter substrate-binding protein [Pelagovum pacificum]|uniref:Extracellular solute-binding protein n=1 Tax=Pelagovum pacificum TaxID=2588711 RepID=A0A5C5GAI2_9RHOB|nr:extracellular solute-binding protein [Pelagovum pacificum]QQA41772.1 extracellular solute-binding protein [Pelagovum pacificum]TNY31045.1 extracellular solute-binding protein [Pelagovum pacificum]